MGGGIRNQSLLSSALIGQHADCTQNCAVVVFPNRVHIHQYHILCTYLDAHPDQPDHSIGPANLTDPKTKKLCASRRSLVQLTPQKCISSEKEGDGYAVVTSARAQLCPEHSRVLAMENGGDVKPLALNHDSGASVNGDGDGNGATVQQQQRPKQKARRKNAAAEREEEDASKRRCVSTACIACRYVDAF